MTRTVPIPQPKGDPFIGNLRSVDGEAPIQGFMRLAQTYGPIFQLDFFGHPLIVVSSQELVNEVCDEKRFDKRVAGALKNIRDFAGDGLFTARTDEPNWAVAHRLLMPAFGPIGIRGMFDRMLDIAEQMVTRWERFGPSHVIEVTEDMTRMTLDTIALCAFDYRFNSFYQTEMHPFVGSMVDALAEAGARTRRPEIASKLLLRTRRAYEDDLTLMRQIADELIAERKRDPEGAQKKDLLGIMLQGRDPVTGEGLSDENIRYQLLTFLIAGHETTSGMLSFATYFLVKNPRVLAKARAEVDAVLGDEVPRIEHIGKLRYVEQVLMEALRIWPTAPAFSLRPNEDTVIGGRYAIRRRDTVMVLSAMLHRDPKVWGDDVEAFHPERFDPESMAALPPNAWKPFGNGQRACIGRPFAMQEAVLLMSLILQRFDLIEDDPSYQLKVAETLTLKPAGFRIRVKRRGTSSFKPRGLLAPQKAAAPAQAPVAAPALAPGVQATPLLVLYGSNTGSCEAFAERIASDAGAQGYAAQAASLDDHAGSLPTEGVVVIITASYEGQPPDNARQFAAWLDTLSQEPGKADSLKGVRYAVFGCGNRQWARTYQAVPQRFDAALEAAGATRLRPRGETDAGGDFFGAFDEWYAALWTDFGQALGKQVKATPAGTQLQVERLKDGRAALLRLGDLQHGEIKENRELVDLRSPMGRSKRHIEIALPQDMSYRAGDYLSVLPHNPIGVVMRALKRFDLASDSQIIIRKPESSLTSLPVNHPVNASEVLFNYVELAQPATRGQVATLADATEGPQQAELRALAEEGAYQRDVLAKRVSVLELLERYPACGLDLATFFEMLPPARARQYSISSSPLWNAERCTLTVAVVDAPALSGRGRYQGMASTYLANCVPGTRVVVAVRSSNDLFHPPASPEVPMVMVCAGTGLAPFRGFLQERAMQAQSGRSVARSLLFFGCDHPDVDFLYKDELAGWEAAGVVSVRPAFFKAPEGEVSFVQHRVWKDRADVSELFRKGAHVYVCGDGRHMAPAVRETFVRIYQEAVGATPEAAEAWVEKIERESGRYVSDVFA
ncbi:bifunctional cytochrome P450/NADPH--P450 reductase [Variovorax sp. JS1663]|uniref:bifunctional cytochrome P450/NADPH--P450 reductase n=1 Tax=Variovorax sp. JS1663 TaxID=1851577 RepID=UPI000B3426A3|nr:cytochrome P450 [Variovorax sp. JS1663]OUM02409.1 cytochrome [Variovorax sp. JS1663]OUM02506.1 cytochrome [Variovorax sp. JS1663]